MTIREVEWAERIAVLELRTAQLERSNQEIKDKLDELLQLRSKGVGAFWLASTLLGTGIVSSFLLFIDWFKGVKY